MLFRFGSGWTISKAESIRRCQFTCAVRRGRKSWANALLCLNRCKFLLAVFLHLGQRSLWIVHVGCFAAASRVRFDAKLWRSLRNLMSRKWERGVHKHWRDTTGMAAISPHTAPTRNTTYKIFAPRCRASTSPGYFSRVIENHGCRTFFVIPLCRFKTV